jgi:hypothetical protein
MRKLILAVVATAIASMPLATVVKAEDTTSTQKSTGMSDQKTIKKHEDRTAPRAGNKMMQHDHNY